MSNPPTLFWPRYRLRGRRPAEAACWHQVWRVCSVLHHLAVDQSRVSLRLVHLTAAFFFVGVVCNPNIICCIPFLKPI